MRTESGAVFAREDRCAHRQMPLHLGAVKGEQLQCCYHGWCYGANRKLIRILYLADGGGKLSAEVRGVRDYPCREAYGLIFFPGARERADRVALPDLPESSSSEYRTMYFSREVRCHYSFMHENRIGCLPEIFRPENPLTYALFWSFLQRTRKSWTGWRSGWIRNGGVARSLAEGKRAQMLVIFRFETPLTFLRK